MGGCHTRRRQREQAYPERQNPGFSRRQEDKETRGQGERERGEREGALPSTDSDGLPLTGG